MAGRWISDFPVSVGKSVEKRYDLRYNVVNDVTGRVAPVQKGVM